MSPARSSDGAAASVIVNGTGSADAVHVSSDTAGDAVVSGLAAQVQVAGAENPASGFAGDTVHVDTLGGDDSVTNGVATTAPGTVAIDIPTPFQSRITYKPT